MGPNDPLPPTIVSGTESEPEPVVPWWVRLLQVVGSFIFADLLHTPTKWTVNKTLCNHTDQPITVLVVDNPWQFPLPGQSPYSKKLFPGKTLGEAMRKAKAAGRTLTLQPKGSEGDCVELEYEYPFRPDSFYVDVFDVRPDHSTGEKPLHGGSYAGRAQPLKTNMQAGDPQVTLSAAIPLPYPMSVESVTSEAIEVVIDRLEGLPKEFELIGSLPAIGKPHRLEPLDRQSEAVIYFRQLAPFSGRTATVTAFQRVVSPKSVLGWPERAVTFRIEPAPKSGEGLERDA